VTDEEGRYVRVNDSLAALTRISADELAGRTLAEVSPEIAGSVDELHALVRETGEPIRERELAVDTPAGPRTVLLSSFRLQGDGETRFGRVVVDITERRNAELRYRELIERLPLVTYVNELAPSYRTVFVSPQIERMFGPAPEAWLENADLWDRVVHPDDLVEVQRLEAAARERRERFELEYRVLRADGSTGWVLDLMQPVYDDDGRPLCEQGFLIDVTERRESESLFRAVFDNAFEAILIADDDGRYVDVNHAACELLGRERGAVLGLTVADISTSVVDAKAAWAAFLEAGESTGSFAVVRPDGEKRELEFAAKANVLPGRHLSVARDVTVRRRLESELGRAQKLESVGRLAGGVAHDFNNMLTAIGGYAQLLRARSEPESVEHHHTVEIERAADRAAQLTAQLLAFGRRQVLLPRAIDLNELIEQRLGNAADVGYRLDPELDAVSADAEQVEQILVNLLANAREAAGARGTIELATRNADVLVDDGELAPGRYVVVTVRDSGPGIDETLLEHIFEPFFTTKAQGEGLGLGLATAYGIARQSGGTIRVESSREDGSTFSVFLPACPRPGDVDPRNG
jgi:two-component system cell cycle sensor histidine kinase/response regulator CckA